MQRVLLVLAVSVSVALTVSCGGGAASGGAPSSAASGLNGDLTVFAASSLTDAFNEIGREFTRANPNVHLTFNFAASSALRTQLAQGAPADVFASADQEQMDQARQAGVIDGLDQVFVKNKLVVIYPAGNPGKIATLEDLARPGIRLVLTDPNVPIGAYARATLDRMSADPRFGPDFAGKVLANLKSEEANVRAAVTKVQVGEADATIVYASDVTPSAAKDIRAVPIPDAFNTIATYPIALVKGARNPAAARAFVAFVRSAAGQAILRQNNFIVDGDTGSARLVQALRTAVAGPT